MAQFSRQSAKLGTYCDREHKIDYVARHIIDADLSGNSAPILEGMLVAGEKMLQSLGQGELQIHFAAVSQHHQKEREPPPGGADRDRASTTPIDLRAFSGLKVQRQEGRFSFGPHLLDEVTQDGIAPGITVEPDLLENLPC